MLRLCMISPYMIHNVDDRLPECVKWSAERYRDVGAYIVKLSAQREKKRERNAK